MGPESKLWKNTRKLLAAIVSFFPLPSFLRPMALTVTLSPVCSRTRFQFQFTRISLCRLMISSSSFDKLFHKET